MNGKVFQKLRGLNETVFKLGMVSLLADVAGEMLYPITPIFLTSVLGAPMAYVGLIEGVAEAVASLLKTSAGMWSDKLGKRKPFIFVGYFLSAIAKPLIGFSTSWVNVLFARSLDRFGKGLRDSPRDAMITEAVDSKDRGIAFGWHRGMDTLGAAIGPLFAILFLNYFKNDLRTIYFWAIIPGLLAAFLVLSLKEKVRNSNSAENKISARSPKVSLALKSFQFKKFLIAWGVFSLTSFSDVFLIMKTHQAGLTLTQTIVIYCFYNLIYAFFSPYLGHLSDIWGRKSVLVCGLLVYACIYAGFAYATSPLHFWILFGVYGISIAATSGVTKAYASDLVPKDMKATGLGVLNTVTGFASLGGGIICGVLWDHYGSLYCFLYGAGGALLTALLI